MVDNAKVGGSGNKIKYLLSFFILKRLIKADFLIFKNKKTFNLLQNAFIQAPVIYYFN